MGNKSDGNSHDTLIDNISLGFTSVLGIAGAVAGVFIPGAAVPAAAIQAGAYCPAIVAAVVKQSINGKGFSKKLDEQIKRCAEVTAKEYLAELKKNDPTMYSLFRYVWDDGKIYDQNPTLGSIEQNIKNSLDRENRWEATGKTPKDIDAVVGAYVHSFFVNAKNYPELNQSILLGVAQKTGELEIRQYELEDRMDETNILDNTRFNHSNQLFKSINIFRPMTNTHKTEEEKRVWDRKEIRAINRDLIQWAITSPLYEMAVGDKDPDQILLSKALGQNESNRYEGSFALMQSIWNRYPELGMAPYYKFLSAKEYSGQYYAGYRDHTTHMFKVFLLGLFLYEKSEKIRSSIIEKIPSQQDFLSVWILTSLYHDVGYVIETEDGCWDSDAGMDVVKRLNDYLAHPFSYLYSDIMDIGTEEALQTKYNLTVAEFCGNYDIQQKLRYFKGIGPLVKLSLEEDANPVQGYYEYASSKRNGRQFFDHGIVGACMLLYSCEAVCDYMQGIKDKSVSIYPNQREKLYYFLAFSEKYKEFTKIAAQAIALHNIQKNWNETEIKDLNLLYGVTINSFCIPQKELPIAYLLRVCDELQCWDRQSFISPLGNTRMPLEQDKLCFLPRPSEVDLSVKNEKKRVELEKALREVLEPPLYTIMELKD